MNEKTNAGLFERAQRVIPARWRARASSASRSAGRAIPVARSSFSFWWISS